jgi:hypothetical protein
MMELYTVEETLRNWLSDTALEKPTPTSNYIGDQQLMKSQ